MTEPGVCPSCGTSFLGTRFCGSCGLDLANAVAVAVEPRPSPLPGLSLAKGYTLAGRYEISSVIAVGAMGTVYSILDRALNSAPRALKELVIAEGDAFERAEAESWFRREGETLRSLRHAAVPRVYDAFSDGTRHYLVMDLVLGATLEDVLTQSDGRYLREDQVLSWADQILDVLSYLHSQRQPLVFRDLKPANVMITPEGDIRLIDFGIARVFSRQSHGTAIGTPGYAPPEQYQGLAEPASDFYALGASMHHLLTGRDPRTCKLFDFPPVRLLAPWISTHVAVAVDRSLVLDPRRRFDTAADMYRALHATTPLSDLPRLTYAAPEISLITKPALPLEADAQVTVHIGQTGAPDGLDVAVLKGGESSVTFGGVTLKVGESGCLELHNHRDDLLACAIVSEVPWLRPEHAAVWLEPHGMTRVTFSPSAGHSPTSSNAPSVGLHYAAPGGTLEGLSIAMRVAGARPPEPFRPRVLPGLMPVAIIAGSNGGFVLLATSHILPLSMFFIYELPALALAMYVQRRRRPRT